MHDLLNFTGKHITDDLRKRFVNRDAISRDEVHTRLCDIIQRASEGEDGTHPLLRILSDDHPKNSHMK